MTVEPYELTVRAITGPDELELFRQLPYSLNHELSDDLDSGRRRPEWMWVALRGGHLAARAAWWGQQEHDRPLLLDFFDLDGGSPDRVEVGARLLTAAIAEVIPPAVARPGMCASFRRTGAMTTRRGRSSRTLWPPSS